MSGMTWTGVPGSQDCQLSVTARMTRHSAPVGTHPWIEDSLRLDRGDFRPHSEGPEEEWRPMGAL